MEKAKLNISQLAPGMRLAEPVVNAAGVALMPAGIRLTPMFIVRLKKWNIEAIEVFIEKRSATATITPDTRQLAKSSTSVNLSAEKTEFARSIAIEVSRWFANVKDNPLMMKLRAVAIRKLVGHGKDGVLNLMRREALEDEASAGGTR